jgi:ATP-binding cassette subfamily F protein 3
LTVYETLATGSPHNMVPAIRNILGGFLFSGDDVYKPVGVLSGGERTRLAVARMLLRPSNTLLLDEPTNHLDLDSKEVLLDALVDYGGTLIFVSHDRYFVERLATKIVQVGDGTAVVYPGTYTEFLWHKEGQGGQGGREPKAPPPRAEPAPGRRSRDDTRRVVADARRRSRAADARLKRIALLESRIAETEQAIRDLERAMAEPGFYDDRAAAQPTIDRHQALMWEVGSLMGQWEALQTESDMAPTDA